jgi:hypothetical protein
MDEERIFSSALSDEAALRLQASSNLTVVPLFQTPILGFYQVLALNVEPGAAGSVSSWMTA